jgi:hypothetical protein
MAGFSIQGLRPDQHRFFPTAFAQTGDHITLVLSVTEISFQIGIYRNSVHQLFRVSAEFEQQSAAKIVNEGIEVPHELLDLIEILCTVTRN